jgi:hypothetical protein
MLTSLNKEYSISHTLPTLESLMTNNYFLKLYLYFRLCGLAVLCLERDARGGCATYSTEETGSSKANNQSFRYKQGTETGSDPQARKSNPTPLPPQPCPPPLRLSGQLPPTPSQRGRGAGSQNPSSYRGGGGPAGTTSAAATSAQVVETEGR